MGSFSKMATVTASTKRPPTISGGKRGSADTNISSLSCLPLDPLDPDIANLFGIETPHELLQTFVDNGLDIRENDVLVVSSVEYKIRAVAEWDWRGADFLHLTLEEIKT